MDLENFVASALTQISKGILAAQEQTVDTGAVINPTTKWGNRPSGVSTGFGLDRAHHQLQNVSFDLVVTVADSTKVSGEGGIQVLGVKVGGGGGAEASSTSQSRISFNVPVIWPIFDYKLTGEPPKTDEDKPQT